MWLACSQRCGSALFRAMFAEVDLDSAGNLLGFRISQPGYLCLGCGAPAFDLSEVPAELAAEEAEERASVPVAVDVLCPVCETAVSVGADRECPNCGAELELP